MSDHTPRRIQLRRTKGWRKPAGAVVVSRPSRWGNPYVVGTPENGGNIGRLEAVAHFRCALREGRLQFDSREVRRELRGRDLACWCPLDQPCHADVLLEVANQQANNIGGTTGLTFTDGWGSVSGDNCSTPMSKTGRAALGVGQRGR